jgi:transketolase
MSATTMREQFAETATALLDESPGAAVALADISVGLFGDAIRAHPERAINVGIREQLLVSVGAGLALSGMRPILHTFASFLVERAFEQVKLDFGHQGVSGVLVSAGASYDMAPAGRTHHAPGDVALVDTLPDWSIHVPGHPAELDALLRAATVSDRPAYIRTSTRQNADPRPLAARGRMALVRRGSRATVVAVGPMLDPVLAATADLEVTVLYAATVRPFDTATLLAALTEPDVILVEPYLEGTSARCVTDALTGRPHRLLCLGVPRTELRRYGTPEDHDRAYGLDPAGIRRRLDAFLGT